MVLLRIITSHTITRDGDMYFGYVMRALIVTCRRGGVRGGWGIGWGCVDTVTGPIGEKRGITSLNKYFRELD